MTGIRRTTASSLLPGVSIAKLLASMATSASTGTVSTPSASVLENCTVTLARENAPTAAWSARVTVTGTTKVPSAAASSRAARSSGSPTAAIDPAVVVPSGRVMPTWPPTTASCWSASRRSRSTILSVADTR